MAKAEKVPKPKVDDELLERFKSDLSESKQFMEPIQQRMDRDYEVYRNWRTRTNDEGTEFKVSDFFEYVETVVPIVTNNRIRSTVHSDYPEYVTHAKGINDILDHTYDVNNWDYMSQEILRLALIYRSSFIYTGYDKKYKNGIGKLCMDQVNGRWCYVDPAVTNLEDSRFFFYVQPMRKTQLFKMYPNKKTEITQAMSRNASGNNNGYGGNGSPGNSWFKTWIGTVKNFLVFNGSNQAKMVDNPITKPELGEEDKHKNVAAYIHYWYRDDNDDWRCSYWADDCFLEDEANPYWHGGLPYDILSPVKDPLSMLGVPMNEQIESMSENRNEMMNYILMNSKLHANPPLLFNTSMGNIKDPQKLKEQADDGVIPVSNPDMVPMQALADYMNVPVMPSSATNVFDQLGQIKDTTTGVNDSFRGIQQASSGKEAQLQQEAAYTRIKTMIDQFELTNKKIADKVIVNAMQFYTTNRGFRIKGDYRKYDMSQQMAEANGEEMPFEVKSVQTGINPETQEPIHDRTEFFLYANPNEWTKLDKENEIESDDDEDGAKDEGEEEAERAYKILQFTVEIEAGSSLPQSRLARREEATELFTAQAIDQQSLLEIYDWPNREEIIKRMGEKAQQAQEAQGQAEAQVEQVKAQSEQQRMQMQMQIEDKKAQTQIQIEQMKLQGDIAKTQANNDAKLEQEKTKAKADDSDKGEDSGGNSLAEMIEQIKKDNPQFADIPDEQIIQALTGEQGQQPPQEQGGGLAEQLDQIRQQNPEAAQMSDEELIAAMTQQQQ